MVRWGGKGRRRVPHVRVGRSFLEVDGTLAILMVRSLRAGGGVEWEGENQGAPCLCKGTFLEGGRILAILRLWS